MNEFDSCAMVRRAVCTGNPDITAHCETFVCCNLVVPFIQLSILRTQIYSVFEI
jgi:hypothetical protein